MLWLAKTVLESTCTIKVSKFPFDEQFCKMKIGSWTFNSNDLELSSFKNKGYLDLAYLNNNTEWEFVNFSSELNLTKYTCCPYKFYDITYTFHFRRKSLYYIISIVVPCVLLSLLSTISFLFPVESGERISLVMSVLLGIFFFMPLVNDKTPVTSDSVPVLTRCFTAVNFIVFLSLLATAFIISMHHASPSRPVPCYLSTISRFFAIVLCLGRPPCKTSESVTNLTRMLGREASEKNTIVPEILNEIQRSSHRQEDDNLKDGIKEQWQHTANVFDRLFFCISLILSIIGVCYFFVFTALP